MESDSQKVLQDLEASKQELKDNLRHLGSKVKRSVDETKDKVDEVMDRVSLKQQTLKRPLTMVGVSLVAGVVLSRFLFRARVPWVAPVAMGKALQKLFTEFQPEIAIAKGMALQMMGQKIKEVVDESYPQWKPQTAQLVESLQSHGPERYTETDV